MKRLLPLFVVAVLTAGSALAAVPIFEFDNATGQLTIDTNGLTLESFTILGPSTDGHTGLPADPADPAPPGVNPIFQGFSFPGGSADGTSYMDWETQYFGVAMQSFDNSSNGINTVNHGGSILYATYVGTVQFGDFPANAAEYFSTEEGIGVTDVTPEPATLTLLGIGGLLALRRRR